MITIEDINRCIEEKQDKKLVVVDINQFFEFEIPLNQNANEFVNSAECLSQCAEQILNQTINLIVDRECKEFDTVNEYWLDP